MSNYKGTPFPPIEAQVDMMRSHSIRPAARSPKRDTDQHTFILAAPPSWTVGVPCIGDFARFDDPTGLAAGEAAARCAGCPAITECLSDALAQEGEVGPGHRYGIRGGMSPKERADYALAHRPCERGHENPEWVTRRKTSRPQCAECEREDSRAAYANLPPEKIARKREQQRQRRARLRETAA